MAQSPRGSGTDLTPGLEPGAPKTKHPGSSQQGPGNPAGPMNDDCLFDRGCGLMERVPCTVPLILTIVMGLGHLVSPVQTQLLARSETS